MVDNSLLENIAAEKRPNLGLGWVILVLLLLLWSVTRILDGLELIEFSKQGVGYVGYILLFHTKLYLTKDLIESLAWICVLFRQRLSILILGVVVLGLSWLAIDGFFLTDDPYGSLGALFTSSMVFVYSLILAKLLSLHKIGAYFYYTNRVHYSDISIVISLATLLGYFVIPLTFVYLAAYVFELDGHRPVMVYYFSYFLIYCSNLAGVWFGFMYIKKNGRFASPLVGIFLNVCFFMLGVFITYTNRGIIR